MDTASCVVGVTPRGLGSVRRVETMTSVQRWPSTEWTPVGVVVGRVGAGWWVAVGGVRVDEE